MEEVWGVIFASHILHTMETTTQTTTTTVEMKEEETTPVENHIPPVSPLVPPEAEEKKKEKIPLTEEERSVLLTELGKIDVKNHKIHMEQQRLRVKRRKIMQELGEKICCSTWIWSILR